MPARHLTREPVTRERIGQAALQILDEASDESALTMRSLADVLGVQAPSLYAHIAGIDDVIDLVHARINGTIDLTPLEGDDSLAGLRDFAHLYREAYRRHPVASSIIVTRTINSGHALAVYEAIASCLGRSGVPAESVMAYMALLDNLVLGSAIEPFAEGFRGPASEYLRRYPHLSEALRRSRRPHIDDEGFELGLSSFVDLVRSLVAPEGAGATTRGR